MTKKEKREEVADKLDFYRENLSFIMNDDENGLKVSERKKLDKALSELENLIYKLRG